ncbi:MAG: Lrp/AsnC family transcriptional regulator, partial [Gammaproteobacteria bacterium]|nr:Lrp/AsnC family transcriptional regulator [Gammaproteobacteria bacterium]
MVLSDKDRQLIAAIQGGLPLVAKPYAAIAAQLGLTEAGVITRLETLQAAGMIKRMGVVVRHRELGYR